MKKVAKKAVSAIGRLFGTNYLIGTGPEIIYAYTGGSSDWAKETAKIKYSYTIELRPSYYCELNSPFGFIVLFISAWNGFVLDKSQLVPTARETFDGIMVVLETVASEARDNAAGIVQPLTTAPFVPTQPRAPVTPRPRVSQPQQRPLHQSSTCRDAVEDCRRWLDHSPLLCATSRISMKRQCALTCNLC